MSSRRTFLQQSSLLALATMAGSTVLNSCMDPNKPSSPIGLQLYTLREDLEDNVIRTIEKVSKIGYGHVETAFNYEPGKQPNFWGMKVQDFKSILERNNLKTFSGHYLLNDFLTLGKGNDDALKAQADIAAEMGQKYLVIPVPPFQLIDQLSLEDFKFIADQLNKGGEYCKKNGLKIAYHNHFWEFRKSGSDSASGYELMLDGTDPELVAFELDIFWAIKSGMDPVNLFEKYPKRFELWHVKDIDKEKTKVIVGEGLDSLPSMDVLSEIKFAEVGSGAVDFKKIFAKAEQAGMKHFYVEQDGIYMEDHFKSIKQSYDYVKKNLEA